MPSPRARDKAARQTAQPVTPGIGDFPECSRYSMARDVACQEVKVPYGAVHLDSAGGALTYEMAPGKGYSAFIPASVLYAQRQADRQIVADLEALLKAEAEAERQAES